MNRSRGPMTLEQMTSAKSDRCRAHARISRTKPNTCRGRPLIIIRKDLQGKITGRLGDGMHKILAHANNTLFMFTRRYWKTNIGVRFKGTRCRRRRRRVMCTRANSVLKQWTRVEVFNTCTRTRRVCRQHDLRKLGIQLKVIIIISRRYIFILYVSYTGDRPSFVRASQVGDMWNDRG